MSMENDGGMVLTGENRRTQRIICPSATFSTTNPTWIDPGCSIFQNNRAEKLLNDFYRRIPITEYR
jgi:hypothetical protein